MFDTLEASAAGTTPQEDFAALDWRLLQLELRDQAAARDAWWRRVESVVPQSLLSSPPMGHHAAARLLALAGRPWTTDRATRPERLSERGCRLVTMALSAVETGAPLAMRAAA